MNGEKENGYDFKLLFHLFRGKCRAYFAGGSALILQMISTFSSFAAPTRTTLSVKQTGASMNENGEMFVFILIMTSQQASVVIKIMNSNE